MGSACSAIRPAAVDGVTNTINSARKNNTNKATTGRATPASNRKLHAATQAAAKTRATKAVAKPKIRGGGAKKPGSSTPAAKKPAPAVSASSSPGDIYKTADPSKFVLKEVRTGGVFLYTKIGLKEHLKSPIEQGVATFQANPSKYIAMTYEADMTMVHKGCKIHAKNKPLLPGRGMGCADSHWWCGSIRHSSRTSGRLLVIECH